MSDMNPVISWKLEKVIQPDDIAILRVYLKTIYTPMEKCYEQSYLYTYVMRDELDAAEPYDAVEVYVDSRGGDFRSALGVYDALMRATRHKPTRTYIINAASAATLFLALRGDTYIAPGGTIFIHRGTQTGTDADGNEITTRSGLAVDAAAEMLVQAYRKAMKKNLSLSEYRARKHAPEVWAGGEFEFSDSEAVRVGLVAEVMGRKSFESWSATNADKQRAIRKFKRRALAACAAVTIAILGGIIGAGWTAKEATRPRLEAGTVIDKKYVPPVEDMPISINNTGAIGGISEIGTMSRGAGYILTVEGEDGRRETWVVNKDVYNRVQIGQRVRKKARGD